MINFSFHEGTAVKGIPSFLQNQKILDMYDNYPNKNIKRLTEIGTSGNNLYALKYKRMYALFKFNGTTNEATVNSIISEACYLGIINATSSWSGAYIIVNLVSKDEIYIDDILSTNERKTNITVEFGYETSPGVLAYQTMGQISGKTPVKLDTSSFLYPVKSIILWNAQDGSSNTLRSLSINCRYNSTDPLKTELVNVFNNNPLFQKTIQGK